MRLFRQSFITGTALMTSALLLTGCQSDSKKSAYTDLFFSAFNHLCEAETLSVDGTIRLSDLSTNIFGAYTSNPLEVALKTSLGPDQDVAFYIKDGKTYLNYAGTKSQSLAANIGIEDDTNFHIPNPFLDLNRKERDAIFQSITKDDDDFYTYTIAPVMMEKLIDDFGAADIERAVMKTKIVNEQIQSLQLEVEGELEIGTSASPIDLEITLSPIVVDQDVQIDFPDDLSSWNEG